MKVVNRHSIIEDPPDDSSTSFVSVNRIPEEVVEIVETGRLNEVSNFPKDFSRRFGGEGSSGRNRSGLQSIQGV